MVTAGLDPVIKLWDLRKASSSASSAVAPLALLSGHVSSLAPPKLKDMHHPEFYANGRYDSTTKTEGDARGAEWFVCVAVLVRYLLSCGERAQRLSIYDVSTGGGLSY